MANQILEECKQCLKTYRSNSEEYYWHLKIHNARLEESILNKQYNRELELAKQED